MTYSSGSTSSGCSICNMDNQTDWDCLTCGWEVPGDIAALQRRQLLGLFGLQFDCQATLQGPTRLHEFLGVFILYFFFFVRT